VFIYRKFGSNNNLLDFRIPLFSEEGKGGREGMSLVIRMNGIPLEQKFPKVEIENVKYVWKPKSDKHKKLATFLWVLSGSLMLTPAYASSNPQQASSIWEEMQPVFKVFQDIAMIMGALAILVGLIVMVFKKKLGWTIVNTAGLV